MNEISTMTGYAKWYDMAYKIIPQLQKIKAVGKAKTAVKDIVTQSAVTNILLAIGKTAPKISKQLEDLLKYTFTHQDLTKLQQNGRMDLQIWRDPSYDGVLNNKEIEEALAMNEGWKDLVAAGAIGLGALAGNNLQADKSEPKSPTTQSAIKSSDVSLLNRKTSDYVGHWEGKKHSVYKDSNNLDTIGIGHYLNNTAQDRQLFATLFGDKVNYDDLLSGKQKLSDEQIDKLFNVDVKIKEKLASKKINNFSSLPTNVKNAIINAFYRGDIGPKTIGLMNAGNWGSAAKEYLNHPNAKSGADQIQRRMRTNALALAQFAQTQKEYITQSDYVIG